MKSTSVQVLGNMDLRPGFRAVVVTSLDFSRREKNIAIGIQFVGLKKKSKVFNFDERIPAFEISVSTHRLYEALAKKSEKPAQRLEKISAQQIAKNGTVRIYGEKEGVEPDVTIDLSFKTHVLLLKMPFYEIMNFVR